MTAVIGTTYRSFFAALSGAAVWRHEVPPLFGGVLPPLQSRPILKRFGLFLYDPN